MNKVTNLFSQKLFWLGLLISHLVILLLLYYSFGFNTLQEGDKYLTRANYLANGDFINSTQYQTFYISYVVYLAAFTFFKIPVVFIFLSTYLISLVAYYRFYQLITALINNQTAKLWLLLMCVSPLIQYWKFNLFSETFFIAVSLLLVYVCLMPQLKYRIVKVILLAIVAVFSRPSGIFTVICVVLFMLYKNKVLTKKQILFSGLTILLILFVAILFFFQLPYHDFSKYISNGSIFYGFPNWTSPELPPGNYTLFNCYQFILEHKGLKTLAGLFIQKFNSFFVTTRPYYSDFHNCINQSHQLLYPFAVLSVFVSYKKQIAAFKFLFMFLCVILLNALMITMIFNEWSERHTLHVFPYIILLASYSLVYLRNLYVKKDTLVLSK